MLTLAALLALAAPAGAAPNATPIDPDQKIRCQREQVTGQLVPGPRVCHTVAEWRQMAEDAQRDTARAREQGYLCPGCQGH